ncbi:MAG: hypothetical protein KAR06_01375 [Deltaproteobacteria bacterium]|nr:hypothetical protein [Deltaproteobacteria bacterium]
MTRKRREDSISTMHDKHLLPEGILHHEKGIGDFDYVEITTIPHETREEEIGVRFIWWSIEGATHETHWHKIVNIAEDEHTDYIDDIFPMAKAEELGEIPAK